MKPGKLSLLTAVILCALVLAIGTARGQVNNGDPELPREQVDTTYPVNTGATINVPSGGDLQKAIHDAHPGDTIMLEPNGVYNGSFILENKGTTSTDWIIIRSGSTAFNSTGSIPPGTCVDGSNSANTSQMPKIISQSNNSPAISVANGAHHYRLVGLDLSTAEGISSTDATLQLGDRFLTSLSQQPSYITVDRCFIHGGSTLPQKRGIDLAGKYMAVINSYISNYRAEFQDTQAIFGSNGAGPFAIISNYLEAAGENIMFGGDDPKVLGTNLVPSDIEIKRNLFTKNLSWRGTNITAKNLFELKNARRVLLDGNVLQNFWDAAQPYAINIKSANQDGHCDWCVSEDITISNNKLRDIANGFDIGARDGSPTPPPVKRVKIYNNLIYKLLPQWGGSYGRIFQIRGDADDIKIIHTTAEGSYWILGVGDNNQTNSRLTFRDNIVERGAYGIKGTDEGTAVLTTNFGALSTALFQKNLLVNTSDEPTNPTDQRFDDYFILSRYPNPAPGPNDASSGDTFVASTWNDVGFIDRANGNYRLSASSRYKGKATDGKDLGADQDAIEAAIEGKVGFSSSNYTVNEGVVNTAQNFGSVTVQVVRTSTTYPLTLNYRTSDQSGGNECDQNTGFASQRCDYEMSVGTVSFAAGQSTQTITIPIINDAYIESPESFNIELQNNVGARIGQTTVTIQDNDFTTPTGSNNPYLSNEFFVRQNYLDILAREPDVNGFAGWTSFLNNCGPEKGFLGAPSWCDRAEVAHGFIASTEFTERGNLIYRMYLVGLLRMPRFNEFIPDMMSIKGHPTDEPDVFLKSVAQYAERFSSRQDFINTYGDVMPMSQAEAFITRLEQKAGIPPLPATTTTQPGQPPQYGRQELINKRLSGEFSVGQTLKAFVQQLPVYNRYFAECYVTMHYFGFLRRDPDLNDPNLIGWNEWVYVFVNGGASRGRPDIAPTDYHHLAYGFIYSEEYRKRFGQP